VLVATDLVRAFDDPARGKVLAVDGVSLRVVPGEVFGLLGPNGAGKTTTLRLLATLLAPDRGTVSIDGVDAQRDPLGARARLGYVPAEAGLPRRLTALEAVTLFARVQGVRDAKAKSEALLERLGASGYQSSVCGSLSTGMKRRVVLARALVHDPPVLLLDEPTDGLDVPGRREVLRLVRDLAASGRAVLLCSHIMGEVEQVCDRAAVLSKGRVAAEGTLDELRARTSTNDLGDAFVHLVDDTTEAERA
jgi:sodium transport system ATP-binding protein